MSLKFSKVVVEEGLKWDGWRGLLPRIDPIDPAGRAEGRTDHRKGKQVLRLARHRGRALRHCLSRSSEYCCCNTYVFGHISNCPFQCSYCFLQYYLNDHAVTVYFGLDRLMEELERAHEEMPWRFFRVGTWELGDSLALEPLLPLAKEFVETFASLDYALLELKTKSASVGSLLEADHRGRTVVSWTVNPQEVIEAEERMTASMDERLDAMLAVARAGYLIGLHFDPMIAYPGWEEGYPALAGRLLAALPQEQIAWISIGSLRFHPEMKGIMERNYPWSRAADAEMVAGPDGKQRYVKPLRLEMYTTLYRAIEANRRAPFLVYFCMERWDVWERVMGFHPAGIGELDYMFASSLHSRFPGLVHCPPDLKMYLEGWDQ